MIVESSAIRFFLIRYGQLGRIGWFGTIHKLNTNRGDRVVVQAIDGAWLGTVLRSVEGSSSDSISKVSPRGELLRKASDSDLEFQQDASSKCLQLVELARAKLSGLNLIATVLDADVSLDQQVGVIQFAGDGGAALGPLAGQIANQLHLERVQWLSIADSSIVDAITEEAADSENEASRETLGENAIQRFLGQVNSIENGQLEGSELRRFANRFRGELGLTGTYLQKIRQPLMSGAGSVDRSWMVRVKATGGQMTVGQFRGLIDLSRRYGDGTLRLTMRQGLQFHHVGIHHPFQMLAAIQDLAMTTRGSCGNSLRNVTCCPMEPETDLQRYARTLAARLANRWLPQAAWLDSENLIFGDWLECDVKPPENLQTRAVLEAEHSLRHDVAYPDGYLPHKWKIAVATEGHNCVNVRANDLGIMLREVIDTSLSRPRIMADCWIGGSLAYRPGQIGSVASLGEPLGTIPVEKLESVIAALMQLHVLVTGQVTGQVTGHFAAAVDDAIEAATASRSTVERRHFRRLKYTVQRMGTGAIAEWINDHLKKQFEDQISAMPVKLEPGDVSLAGEWLQHGGIRFHGVGTNPSSFREDGCADENTWTACIAVRGGRLRFTDQNQTVWQHLLDVTSRIAIGPRHTLVVSGKGGTGLDMLCRSVLPGLAEQLILETDSLYGHAPEQVVEKSVSCSQSGFCSRVLTCVGLPTCPLAVEQAESTEAVWRIETAKAENSLVKLLELLDVTPALPGRCADGRPSVAVSGCSNGCSAPLMADLGIVAESKGSFRVFLGGGGDRLGIPVGVIDGPENLASLIEDLWRAAVVQRKKGISVRRWLLERPVSRNFAWLPAEN